MEKQNDVLKKMGSYLTKLKEAKLKKPNPHVEVLDKEEVEDWDEREKVDYERNKQFKKLTAKIVAMREKMEKMQLAFRKAQGMNDCLYNMAPKLSLHYFQSSRFLMWKSLMELETQSNMLGDT